MKKTIILATLVLASLVFFDKNASAQTIVAGNITQDTAWISADSPYIIPNSVFINSGVTLTIEEGVIVKFDSLSEMVVDGTLLVNGSSANQVYFTSIKDDSAGGDTNGDGALTLPAPGDWLRITFQNGSTGVLNYVVQKYADQVPFFVTFGAILNNGGDVTISNSIISDYRSIGIYQDNGSTTLNSTEMSDSQFGIDNFGGSLVIQDSFFHNLFDYAVQARDGTALNVSNTRFENNGIPLALTAGVDFVHTGNSFINNIENGYSISGNIFSENQVWKNDDVPYIVSFVGLFGGSSLTIESGAILKFKPDGLIFVNEGSFVATGMLQKPIYFTSMKDDSVGGDTNGDGNASSPTANDFNGIQFITGTIGNLENFVFKYGGGVQAGNPTAFFGAINSMGGSVFITNGQLSSNGYAAIRNQMDGVVQVSNSSISGNPDLGVSNETGILMDAKNNWWGDSSGPKNITNLGGLGDGVSSNVDFIPWLNANPFGTSTEPACCSSVAFIPGTQASRLYLQEGAIENRLWEPNISTDVEKLYLDDSGNSVNTGVYTRDTIGEAFGFNVYKNFKEFMNGLTTEPNQRISEWKELPYDWRRSITDIVNSGTVVKEGDDFDLVNMADELVALADRSQTKKVNIIGHSNGGLIGKLLINELESRGKVGIVDKFIMVATPQLGTPKAIAGLLHGDEQIIPPKIGIILDRSIARKLGENMPGAYSLLPSLKYFSEVFDPVIEFDPEVSNIYNFQSFYGDSIDSRSELESFLLGESGARSNPNFSDTDSPNILNQALLNNASSIQNSLDSWVPPAGIKVIQIVGWGLDTIRGIRYDDCDISLCPNNLSNLDRDPVFTLDGDKTVVVPSANAIQGVDTYYLNLRDYNISAFINRGHTDILEAGPLQNLIEFIIVDSLNSLPQNISTDKPPTTDIGKTLRFRVYSPVSLDVYDSDGNHTGLVTNSDPNSDFRRLESNVPNSYYLEFGEAKYAAAGTLSNVNVVLIGEEEGAFTLEIDELIGDEVIKSNIFTDIPVVKNTRATVEIVDTTVPLSLLLDVDNDGITDLVLESGEGVSTEDFIKILRGIIKTLDISDKQKKKLGKVLYRVDKTLAKEEKCENKKKESKCEFRIKHKLSNTLDKFGKIVERFVKKDVLSKDEAENILQVMLEIKKSIIN